MKVIRIFGIVAAVHAFAFILIMANPGCSTKPKAKPTPVSTEAAAPSPSISVPVASTNEQSPISSAPLGLSSSEHSAPAFDPNAVALSGAPRYSPTRPGTPASSALQSEPVADVTQVTTITVGKGDSLWSIAKKYGVPVAELAEANHMKVSATLHPGRKLMVPSKAGAVEVSRAPQASAPAPTQASTLSEPVSKPSASGSTKHVVKNGETLSIIARKYGVKSADIAVANNITNPASIRVGRELTIPGGSVAKAPKSSTPSSSSSTQYEPESTPAPAQKPAQSQPAPTQIPQIGIPAPDQDLDAGLKPAAPTSDVPVIKIDDNAGPAPKTL